MGGNLSAPASEGVALDAMVKDFDFEAGVSDLGDFVDDLEVMREYMSNLNAFIILRHSATGRERCNLSMSIHGQSIQKFS
jgi:hypothetical protein